LKTRTVFAFATVCALLMIGRGAAEAQESYATLLGKISDQRGAGVAGAKVTVTSKETGLARVVSTTGDGNYRVTLLHAGGYSFKVESSGFRQTYRQTSSRPAWRTPLEIFFSHSPA
jgi:Carboxypeptidase regulatory-like domain